MSAAAILNISKDGEAIKSVAIEGEAVLGRSEGCLIRLDDRAISRQHAIFTQVAGGVQVERKSEFAPISVNGAECTRALIKEGDVIEIGPYLMKLGKTGASSITRPVAPPAAAKSAPESIATPQRTSVINSEGELVDAIAAPSPEPLEALHVDGGHELLSLDAESPEVQEPLLSADAGTGSMASAIADALENGQLEPANEPASEIEGLPDIQLQNAAENANSEPLVPVAEAIPMDEIAESTGESNLEPPSFDPQYEDAETKLLPGDKLSATLRFAEGVANVVQFQIEQEASIGRGKGCDVILKDKKASRKHAIIRRDGAEFIIKDLNSANGTFVNGMQISEKELSGEDVIRIGNTEFNFKAVSQDYLDNQNAFIPVPVEPEEAGPAPVGQVPGNHLAEYPPAYGAEFADPAAGQSPNDGIAGISKPVGKKKNQSLMEKFRALPKRRQQIMMVCIAALVYFLVFDDDTTPPPPPKTQKVQSGVKNNTFDSLSPEQKKFVETEHDLAFDYYKNKEYDKTLYELAKIFALIPDYKDSHELELYAKEGKRKLEALEEERKKKEEEEKLKMRIADLVDQAKGFMDKHAYEKAHDVFPEILALDPDNANVADWAKTVDAYEEQKAMEEQARQVQAQINKRGWEIYAEGVDEKKQGKFKDAIATFQKVADIGASDKKLSSSAIAQMRDCQAQIAALRDPLLDQAKQAEDNQDYPNAFQLYLKATEIDPSFPTGFAGMARIRGILHDRAKGLYIEAVLAESYSDFATAKKKFQDCLDVAPKDDIYHDRSERKLASYFSKAAEAPAQ